MQPNTQLAESWQLATAVIFLFSFQCSHFFVLAATFAALNGGRAFEIYFSSPGKGCKKQLVPRFYVSIEHKITPLDVGGVREGGREGEGERDFQIQMSKFPDFFLCFLLLKEMTA